MDETRIVRRNVLDNFIRTAFNVIRFFIFIVFCMCSTFVYLGIPNGKSAIK